MMRKFFTSHGMICAAVAIFQTAFAAGPQIQWTTVNDVRLPVPPAEHPRLYLRAEHVATLPARLKHPVLQPAVERLQAQARKSPQLRVEWEALQYLVSGDASSGRAVIEAALALLQKCELADRQDACRETGRMMVTGAIVYDWCYRLLAAEEKQAFIKELVRLAKTQECGYPPTGQGSVTGHSSEAMIMRDMLSAGIAIYDEFPEMYRLAAGRFFREHLPARNWFYPGHAYHQGDSYNFANAPDPERASRSSVETSAWRLELSPQAAAAEDSFLTVMQMTDRELRARWPVRRVEAPERTGCVIHGPDTSWTLLFRRDTIRSAAAVEFSVTGSAPTRVLVADLAPGHWQARRAASPETRLLSVPEDSGTAWFEAGAGTWTLTKP